MNKLTFKTAKEMPDGALLRCLVSAVETSVNRNGVLVKPQYAQENIKVIATILNERGLNLDDEDVEKFIEM